jgi:hypothetical protein
MSSSDMVTTILSMYGSDLVEIMALLGGLGGIIWVMRALVSWTTRTI